MDGIDTVADVLPYAARQYGTKAALGYRDIVGLVEEETEETKVVEGKETVVKKKWTFFQLSDYKYISFIELKNTVDDVARGLVDIGVTRADVLNIFASTRCVIYVQAASLSNTVLSHHWQIVQHACMQIGTTIATAYDTLGEDGLTHSLNEPEVAAVFTNADLLDIFSRVLANTPTVRFVIYDGTAKPEVLDKIRSIRSDLVITTLDELRARGQGLEGDDRKKVDEQVSRLILPVIE